MYYIFVFLLIALGVSMQLDIFKLDEFTVACLNVSALFLTIAGISYEPLFSNVRKNISKALNRVMLSLGAVYFLLAITGSGFIWYGKIKSHMLEIDSNAVLLIALAATIATIALGRKYSENRLQADEKKIQALNSEILSLKKKMIEKDTRYNELIEKFNTLKLQNQSLIQKLNHTTTVMEAINKKLKGGNKGNE